MRNVFVLLAGLYICATVQPVEAQGYNLYYTCLSGNLTMEIKSRSPKFVGRPERVRILRLGQLQTVYETAFGAQRLKDVAGDWDYERFTAHATNGEKPIYFDIPLSAGGFAKSRRNFYAYTYDASRRDFKQTQRTWRCKFGDGAYLR